jgi:hypothetical protein
MLVGVAGSLFSQTERSATAVSDGTPMPEKFAEAASKARPHAGMPQRHRDRRLAERRLSYVKYADPNLIQTERVLVLVSGFGQLPMVGVKDTFDAYGFGCATWPVAFAASARHGSHSFRAPTRQPYSEFRREPVTTD